jgi:D-3-phosphoglycerate dehydrogenase / 2-oxoglutarate reductase
VTPETRHLFDAARLAACRAGVRIVNTARGELIDEAALAEAIESGHVAGAALDVFETEPPTDWRLARCRRSWPRRTSRPRPSRRRSRSGLETGVAVRDFLQDGIIRAAVNFPAAVSGDAKVQPLVRLADRMGALLAQIAAGRTESVSIRYYGDRTRQRRRPAGERRGRRGVLRPLLSSAVTDRERAPGGGGRGIEIIESRSSRARDYADMLSLKLHTTDGEFWIEGAVFEPGKPRLTCSTASRSRRRSTACRSSVRNQDQPGVIGEIGTILGRHGINIASFALGRDGRGAVGVVNVDPGSDEHLLRQAVEELRRLPAIITACIVRH